MLLNLSNHPSAAWSSAQVQAAIKSYGSIEDMPFPPIDPKADESAIQELAIIYLEKIRDINPNAVHIMGELTFTFELVRLLQTHGITCIASTTHRSTIELEDGTKNVKFEFVRFRAY
ncbi:CRISPR-associated protein [Algoriphagus formosus]|uniref:CRISPR-associated protein n=1 Tax=Algoriphagus formosus TaxID=2007308 RepID=UPI000C28E444|nr:CRISPR-associated protein [Algoriphagus formosus]